MLEQKIIAWGLKVRKWSFLRIIQRTFAVLFPFILIGSFAQVLEFSLLYRDGFLANLTKIYDWLPHYQAFNQLFGGIYMLTAGIISVFAAGLTAKYTAQFAKRDGQIAGVTGMIAFLAICYQHSQNGDQLNFKLELLGFSGLILGLLYGYFVGLLFKWANTELTTDKEHNAALFERSFRALLPITFALIGALVINVLLGLIYKYQVFETINDWLQSQAIKQSGVLPVFLLATLTLIFSWLGLSGPYESNTFDSDQSALHNLNYALTHSDLAKVPDKFNANTLYFSFGTLSGTGALLALILALFIVSHRKNNRRLAYLTVFPGIFNANASFMIGLPILFNPFYLVPFLLIPLFNMLIGALLLASGLILPAVYPVLLTTPGVLYSFIGTNGAWVSLLVPLFLLICDTCLYIPFVRFAEKISDAMEAEQRKEGVAHEVK